MPQAGAAAISTLVDDIYYFAYGALVNPLSRQRRCVKTLDEQAAVLPNYRLTFGVGGAANIIPKQGWDVHGVLMKCASAQDFETLRVFDAGYDCIQVDVYPIANGVCEAHGDGDQSDDRQSSIPIPANAFVMHKDKDENFALPTDKLPQERYLRVIAWGMREYGLDDDYINDQIMGVPYIPNRNPDQYLQFPISKALAKMTLNAWNKKCKRKLSRAIKHKKNLLIFRIGKHVMQVGEEHDPRNQFCVWIRERLLGPHDSTWVIVQTLYDPDLPFIDSPIKVQEIHRVWAENQMMEKFEQAGITATRIVQVSLDNLEHDDHVEQVIKRRRETANTTSSFTTTEYLLSEGEEEEGQVKCGKRSSLRSSLKTCVKSIRSSFTLIRHPDNPN